jgi:hypothetical protein
MPLVDLFVASTGMSFPGYEHEEYHARVLYRGVHLLGVEEPRFASLEFGFGHLTEWIGESGFRGERTLTPRISRSVQRHLAISGGRRRRHRTRPGIDYAYVPSGG